MTFHPALGAFSGETIHITAKVSKGTNRNTMVQLLAPYTNPESHGAQRHRQTDRQTDVTLIPFPIADHHHTE